MNTRQNPIYRCVRLLLLLVIGATARADDLATAGLMAEYDKEVLAKVTPGYEKEMTAVKAKYAEELKQSLARATKAGKLELAVPLKDEIERIDSGTPIPDSDMGVLPELVKLRSSFRAVSKRLAAERDSKLAPIIVKYDRSLADMQTALTKAGKLDDALAVKKQREVLHSKTAGAPVADGPVNGRVSRVRLVKEVPPANTDGWIVLYEAGRLSGCAPDMELIRSQTIGEQDGNLRLDHTGIKFDVQARDLEFRVTAKKVTGRNLSIGCREQIGGDSIGAWFNGGNNFGVGRILQGKWRDLRATTEGPMKNEFFELRVVVRGTSIQTFLDGQKQFDFENNHVTEPGRIGVNARGGVSLFRKIEVKIEK